LKHSYTSADQWPLKLAKNPEIIRRLPVYVPPYHLQVYPTNKCNRNCSFCSCKNRDKSLELSFGDVVFQAQKLGEYGTRAVTISGGGEPLLHPHINEIIRGLWNIGFEVGLTTNGDYLNVLNDWSLSILSWVRISGSDEYGFDPKWWLKIAQPIIEKYQDVSWSFSYVATKKFDHSNLNDYIYTADKFNFSHVRVVWDLLDRGEPPVLETKSKRVIWQPRDNPRKGAKECWFSLIKPLLAADGYIYPCCGVQYARKNADLDNPKEFRMEKIPRPWVLQKPFNGELCERCYYSEYNDYISRIKQPVDHATFI